MALSRFLQKVDYFLARTARPYVPFTPPNIAWWQLDKQGRSILDVGCGQGRPMKFINRHRKFFTVGADIFDPYLREAKWQQTHDEYILCDIRCLPFRRKSFDIVLCLEVLEHLNKTQGHRLIGEMEEIAKKQVIISTPVGMREQHSYNGDRYQEHRGFWLPDELKHFGYRVRGCGFPNIGGKSGLTAYLPGYLRLLNYILYVLVGPFVYFLPRLAGGMVCVKEIKS